MVSKKQIEQILQDPSQPVKPSINDFQKVAAMITDNNELLIIYDQGFYERLPWVEYDADMNTLKVMSVNGNMFDIGLEIQDEVARKIPFANKATLMQVTDNKIADLVFLPLTVINSNLIATKH